MDVVIIEDEMLAAKRLHELVKKYNPAARILAKLESVKASVKWLKENAHPDILLMDIQLADGLSFEIFDEIIPDAPIIFTTAFDEYAIRAFKVNSIDYILKPIDYDELSFALDKFNRMSGESRGTIPKLSRDVSDTVMRMIKNEYKDRFAVKVGEHIKIFTTDDIVCFYSFDKSTYASLINGRNYILDYSLEQLEHVLDPEKFFRINRKFIVKHEGIKEIISYSNSRLKIILSALPEEADVVVSREKVPKFKAWLGYL